MPTLTMCYFRGGFIVSGRDIEPVKFKLRREAKDWCVEQKHPHVLGVDLNRSESGRLSGHRPRGRCPNRVDAVEKVSAKELWN
jgi:hypothetical protein